MSKSDIFLVVTGFFCGALFAWDVMPKLVAWLDADLERGLRDVFGAWSENNGARGVFEEEVPY